MNAERVCAGEESQVNQIKLSTGRIYYWSARGFGFITEDDPRERNHFFHITQVRAGTPRVGAKATFLSSEREKGFIATKVEIEPLPTAAVELAKAGV
jgi:cold shock CspA family protein